MQYDVPIRQELEIARAEEAEALRRAIHLRAVSASYTEIQQAMRHVDSLRARVNRLQQELRAARLH